MLCTATYFVPWALLLHKLYLYCILLHVSCQAHCCSIKYILLCALLLCSMGIVALYIARCRPPQILYALLLHIYCMLCTDVSLDYGYWCYIYHMLCIGTATLCLEHCCFICCMLCTPICLCLRHCCFTHCM